MNDGIHAHTAEEYEQFGKFAFYMIRKGICSKIYCADYRHGKGPDHNNEPCWVCMGKVQWKHD